MNAEHLARLIQLRHDLHQIPELSGSEEKTADFVAKFLGDYDPDQLLTGLGGYGVAAIYDGAEDGPTVLIRCELDGLPIQELCDTGYRSIHPGRGHLCGHDGHMAMVAGLAMILSKRRPCRGRVVLLFQPAEETGKGAAAVIADPRFAALSPDYAFALHNLPGFAVGQVALCTGPANCASRGMRIRLIGKTSHAAAPQDGASPARAMIQLMPALVALGDGGDLGPNYSLVTLTHSRLGEATFSIAPGEGEIWVTLRTVTDAAMGQLIHRAKALVTDLAVSENLAVEVEFDDEFLACTNHSLAIDVLGSACQAAGYPAQLKDLPQLWSEDFGQFSAASKTAMFWLGSGVDQPQLHNPDYDFPDTVLPIGTEIFAQVIEQILKA